MAPVPEKGEEHPDPRSLRGAGGGALLVAGAGLVALSLVLPHPSGADTPVLIGLAAGMAVAGRASGSRPPSPDRPHLGRAWRVAALMSALLIYESGVAAGQYGSIFVWVDPGRRLLLPPPGRGRPPRLDPRRLRGHPVSDREHRRLLAADPLALHRDLADRRDDC